LGDEACSAAARWSTHVTITGHPTPSTTFTFKGTEVGFVGAPATLEDTFTGTATVKQNGSQTLVTQGRIGGGNGVHTAGRVEA